LCRVKVVLYHARFIRMLRLCSYSVPDQNNYSKGADTGKNKLDASSTLQGNGCIAKPFIQVLEVARYPAYLAVELIHTGVNASIQFFSGRNVRNRHSGNLECLLEIQPLDSQRP